MIEKRDICSGLLMSSKKFIEILRIYHISRGNDHVAVARLHHAVQIFRISFDICVIVILILLRICKYHLQISALGINVVMSSGSDMLYQRTWFSSDIHLNSVNTAVGHIGNREVNHTISAQEGEGRD